MDSCILDVNLKCHRLLHVVVDFAVAAAEIVSFDRKTVYKFYAVRASASLFLYKNNFTVLSPNRFIFVIY
jgi:hypothetical protein